MTETITPGTRHKQLMAAMPAPLRNPHSAFPIKTKTWLAKGREYPRAGVRLQPDGKWLVQLWYTSALVRHDVEPMTHNSRLGAFSAGRRDVHAARARKHPAGQIHLGAAKAVPA